MYSHNKQTRVYTQGRPLKSHEQKMIELLKSELSQDSKEKLLDIGCSDGMFLRHLRSEFASLDLWGLELDDKFIQQGKAQNDQAGVQIMQGDASSVDSSTKYDVILASGILSVFDEPFPILEGWLNCLASNGILIVFGYFNERDLDTRIHYRNHFDDHGWETGLTAYSQKAYQKYFGEKGQVSVDFIPFVPDFDIQEDENPIRSYTVQTKSGKRLIVIGGHIICNMGYMILRKQN